MTFDPKTLNNFPSTFGVYLMQSKGRVLYVGKAKNLKKRLKQYFSAKDSRATINILISQIEKIDTIVVNTEKEALILENTLIKKYKPKYNILLKDDKTYVSLMITKEKWPLIKLIRKKGHPKNEYFGPYTNAKAARQTLDLILRLFPLRQCSNSIFKNRTRPCILYDIKRCLAPCVNKCTKQEYDDLLENAKSILKGKNKEVIKNLKLKIQQLSDNLEFEKANDIYQILKQITHVQQLQHVENLSSKNVDAIGFFSQDTLIIITKLMFRENHLIGSLHFSFHNVLIDIESILESFIIQHYKDNLPSYILTPISLKKDLTKIVKAKVINPQKGEKLRLVNLAQKNAKMLFEKEKNAYSLNEKILLNLQETLHLNNFPRHIDCFDISNISQTMQVASKVTFINGKYDKKQLRLFKIKTQKKGDIAALEEVLLRYFTKNTCDLLIVDGGKAQFNAALKTLEKLNIANIDIIGIAKDSSKHTFSLTKEKIFINKNSPIYLDTTSTMLFLLQKIRDQAHRAAITFFKKKSSKLIDTSLKTLKGIGPKKAEALLQKFKSIENIKKAPLEEIKKIKILTKKDLEILKKLKG